MIMFYVYRDIIVFTAIGIITVIPIFFPFLTGIALIIFVTIIALLNQKEGGTKN